MANLRLTQRRINSFKSGKSVREFRDAELHGFGVRVMPTGRKRYFVHSQYTGQRVWQTIGNADDMALKEARERARSHTVTKPSGLVICRPGTQNAALPF